jgi:aminoglycoside phosphotransferase (APT) family kinase protein
LASTQSADEHLLEVVGGRLGVPAARLAARWIARGVTHATAIIRDEGTPVAVVRLAPPDVRILPGLGVDAEGEVLQLFAATEVPVPEVLIRDLDGSSLGRPGLVTRYVSGVLATTWDDLREKSGEASLEDALRVLAALHAMRPAAGHRAGLDGSAQARVAAVARLAEQAGPVAPAELTVTLEALSSAPPPAPAEPGWVHGDFRPPNLIVDGDRVVAVLDWEMAGPGDPARDLGISTMPIWGSWWEDEQLLDRYRAAGGAAISPVALRWWRCLGYGMVTGFLSCRLANEWGKTPPLEPFVRGLVQERANWEQLA